MFSCTFSLLPFLSGTEERRRGLYDRGGGTSIRALPEYLQARTFCTWQANKVRNMRGRLTVCDMQIQHNLYLLPDVIRTHACLMVMEAPLGRCRRHRIHDNTSREEAQPQE